MPVGQSTSLEGNGGATPVQRDEQGEPREKRPRDRNGRERGPRQERGDRADRPDLRIPAQEAALVEAASADTTVGVAAPAIAPTVALPTPTVQTAATAPVASKAATPAVASAGNRMPTVTAYALPIEALVNVAQDSGLQWVNSDAARIAAVQSAIAAEPTPIHVPRARPAPVAMDHGPLVLVETKRDLRNMTLPFEQSPAA